MAQKTRDVVLEITCDVGKPAVGMVLASDTTPLAMSSEVVASSSLVRDRLQLVSSGLQYESLIEIGASYWYYTVKYAHQFTFDDHVDEMMIRRCTLVPSACHQLWDGLMPRDESCDGHDMAIGSAGDSLIIHGLEQEFGSDGSAVVVVDSARLAISSSNLADDQSQLVVSRLQDESLAGVGSFYRHYTAGYVHRFAFDPCVEESMADRFGLGSSFCYLPCDDYSPSAVHGCYGYETMAGDLQSCVNCSRCTVCGFSVFGTVSCRSGHHCSRVGVCIPHSTVGCVDGVYYVGSLGCPLYFGFDVLRVCASWVLDCGSSGFGVQLRSGSRFIHGFLLVIFQRLLQEPTLTDSSLVHDYIWDPGGLTGFLFSHCLGTSNFRKGGL